MRYSPLEDKMQFKQWFIIFITASVACVMLVLLYTIVTNQPNGMRVEEIVLTSDPNQANSVADQVYYFDRDVPRIYCQIVTKGVFGLPRSARMLVKWYYGSEQLTSHYFEADTRNPALVWLEPGEREMFYPGKYAVEIYIDRTLVNTVEFKID